MRITYYVLLHSINLVYFIIYCILGLSLFSNIASGAKTPMNPVNLLVLSVLLICLIMNYIIQLKQKTWFSLIVGSIVYACLFLFIIILIYPFLYDLFGYN